MAAPGKDKAKELDGPANDLRRKAQLIKLGHFTAKLRHFFKYKSNVAYHQLLGGLLRQSVHGSVSVEVALPTRAGRSGAAPLWRYPLRQLMGGDGLFSTGMGPGPGQEPGTGIWLARNLDSDSWFLRSS